jgi:RND family efflux transporter MFP subunit
LRNSVNPKWKRVGVLAVVVVLAAAAWGGYVWMRPSGVKTVTPTRGPAVEAVYATGTVEPVIKTAVAPTVTGRLIELKVKEGAKVKRGDILARLDDNEERARVRELEARLVYYTNEAVRLAKLFKQNTVSASARDQAVSQRDAARGALAVARAKLAELVLRAPIAGLVLRRDGEVGDTIASGTTVFTIGALANLRVSTDVDEADILRIRPGQRAVIRTDALAGRALDGKVDDITPLGDPVARSYRVRVGLPATTPLLVGMTVEVNIVVREDKNALLLPERAVKDGKVWLVRGARVHRQAVRTGVVGNGRVEILSGLGERDMVIVDPPKRLRPGMALRNIVVN